MLTDIRQHINSTLDEISEEHLPIIAQWLELLAHHKNNTEIEPEEMWLLASGELQKMSEEINDAPEAVEDWRKYFKRF